MRPIFIAHAEEDFALVRKIAQQCEANGLECWFYERDTVPAQSYLAQVHRAVCAAEIVIAIVSEHALKSNHVDREIDLACIKSKPYVPVFRGVSSDRVESMRPNWTVAFGTTVRINDDGNHASVLEKLSLAVARQVKQRQAQAQQAISPSPSFPPPAPLSLGTTPPWASDGTQVDPQVLEQLVVRTSCVNEFFSGDEKLFISGTKGLGKTLLLRYKRFLLTERHSRQSHGGAHADVLLIPADRPYLDMMIDLPTISDNHRDFLATLRNAKRLWAFAIRLSVICQVRNASNDLLGLARHELPDLLHQWLTSHPVGPCVIFKQLLSESLRFVHKLLDKLEGPLDQVMRSINRTVYVFIDKVDQGVGHLDWRAWSNIQGGLLEAAWDCSVTNAHVKVFGTIREEAYANYESPIKANVRASVVPLRYGSDELRRLIDRLAAVYEGTLNFSSFVHLDTVHNTRAGIVEDSFAYLSRHTVGRPRDLVHLCSALSGIKAHISEKEFRSIVNLKAADDVVETLFVEMEAFLDCLRTASDRARLFQLLPYNILTRQQMRNLTLEFNGIDWKEVMNADGIYMEVSNPFLELWYCGLLGTIEDDPTDDAHVQRFKQPHDSFRMEARRLNESTYYLLHPSLQTLIARQRTNERYKAFKFVVVGHGCKWHRYNETLIDVQRELPGLNGIDPAASKIVDEALPYLHAAWSENRDVTEYMPYGEWKKLTRLASKAKKGGQELLHRALGSARGNGASRRRRTKRPASTPQGEGEGPR